MSLFNSVESTKYLSETNIRWVQQEKRDIRIKELFYNLNQKTTSKLEEEKIIVAQQACSKNRIAILQAKIDKQFHRYSLQKEDFKQKLMTIQIKVKEADRIAREKLSKRKEKIAKLKRMIEYQFIQHKYISQSIFSKASPNIQDTLVSVKGNNEVFNDKTLKSKLLASKNKLQQQMEVLQHLNAKNKQQNTSELQATANQFQKKIGDWKKGLLVTTMTHNQILKELRAEIETATREINAELIQQRQVRQENKEKLLVLLQNSSASMVGHKIKRATDK